MNIVLRHLNNNKGIIMNQNEAMHAIARIAIKINEAVFAALTAQQTEKTAGILEGLKRASQITHAEYKLLTQEGFKIEQV